MIARGFLEIEESKSDLWWIHQPISVLKSHLRPIDLNIFAESATFAQGLNQMTSNSVDCLIHFENK